MSKRDVRADVLQAVCDVCCKHGPEHLTTKKLGEEARCSEAMIYYHFKSKQEILEATFLHIHGEIDAVFREHFIARGLVLERDTYNVCVETWMLYYGYWRDHPAQRAGKRMTERENRAAGCIFGGAAGDALGYPVEFMEADTIFFRYGDRGITRYTTANGKALISDDTQMTLFTADGLFAAERRYRCPTAAQYIGCIHENYLNWLVTQDKDFRLPEGVARSPLLGCGELYARRAPGGTCLSALESGYCGTFDRKLNRSKGCGGVMRVAPVAVRFAHQRVSAQDVAHLAAQAAAVTHGHPLGYIPAAFLAGLILRILRGEELRGAVQRARHDLFANFDDDADLRTFLERIDAAVALADDGTIADDLDAIRALGAGCSRRSGGTAVRRRRSTSAVSTRAI